MRTTSATGARQRRTNVDYLGKPLGDAEALDERGVIDALRSALSAKATRVIDLFKRWDENGDGVVSRAEFHQAMM